ncbi:MAG: diguanylate cyclase [Peptococcaceae bacterium]|nr:diguanylate cyclase [Peptococcaceae bacterium]
MSKKSKVCIIVVIFILFIILLPSSGFATNNDSRKTLVLLGNENLAPIVYKDNGIAKGVAVDIVKAMEDRIGYEVEVVPVNWEQAQKMMLNGDADGLLHINQSPERDELFDFSRPLLKSDFSMFVQNDSTSLRSIDDLRGKIVGVEAGGYPNLLLQGYEAIDIEIIVDWETSFKALSTGNLDAIIVDRWIGEYELANSRITGIKIVEPPIETRYSRIAVRKGDVETLNLINSGLKEITDDETIDKIMEQWQGKRVIYVTEDYFQTFYLRSASLFLFLVALVAIYFARKYQKLSKTLEISVKERTEELHHANEMLKAANLKLERISMTDGLTSTKNRRAFDITYNKTWKMCLRERMPLALIMIDIDNFKLFNDTYGHLTGDQTLIRIGEVIKGVIKRPGDLAARYGGEEFVVMLMNTTAEGATVVAEEIRTRTKELEIENGSINDVITVSLGVASVIPDKEMAPKELIDAADRALYKAKESGRNKVIVWKHQEE